MDLVLKNKKSVIALVLLLIAFFFYSVFFAPEPEINAPAAVPGEDLLNIANKLSGINFNQELFKMRGYRALTDFSVAIPQEATGRTNPFEVIGRE